VQVALLGLRDKLEAGDAALAQGFASDGAFLSAAPPA
jgi:hypothetical protein